MAAIAPGAFCIDITNDGQEIPRGEIMKGLVANKHPAATAVEAGQTYFWCACGKSNNQPFCDGAHKGSQFTPVAYSANETKTVYFCQCKQTSASPFCDGAHKTT